ncbi:RNA polymerase sigma factor [Streptomyces sp. NPDC056817]|uniref:RNA polymerase sigma factor n=1 Tax=Streptomyces sp. NPDC056817 TaxID=3345950 RepID=UPI0036D02DF1
MGQEEQAGHAESDTKLGAAVAQAQDGDETAFMVVYRIVQPGLLGYLHGLVGQGAEEVASEAWHEIVRDLDQFQGNGAGFRGWSAAIARRRALDHLRRSRRRSSATATATALEPEMAEIPSSHSTCDQVLTSLSTDHVLTLIRGLPRDQADAVLLRVVVGLDGPAAARVLGKRPRAVRATAYQGLRRLARQLAVRQV